MEDKKIIINGREVTVGEMTLLAVPGPTPVLSEEGAKRFLEESGKHKVNPELLAKYKRAHDMMFKKK